LLKTKQQQMRAKAAAKKQKDTAREAQSPANGIITAGALAAAFYNL